MWAYLSAGHFWYGKWQFCLILDSIESAEKALERYVETKKNNRDRGTFVLRSQDRKIAR